MSNNVHLRFLGVFQPGAQIGQSLASLARMAQFPGLNHLAQARHHLPDGPQFLRYGHALGLKRITFFFCSDEYQLSPRLLC